MVKFKGRNDKAYEMVKADIEELVENSEVVKAARDPGNNMTKQDRKCIQDLRVTDPCHDKERIEKTKGGLLEDSYRWILQNPDFQRWRDDDQSRLLWIKGDPGKGKTMLLCGIINELNKPMTKTGQLSFFFCQATDSRINSATAVLRGLLYLLINQQPSFVPHLRKKYDHAGKALFEDANAWVALSKIFTNILQDSNLNTTYLIIDALDECVLDLPKLLDFVVQQCSLSPCVKWVVSSRNWPSIEEQLVKAGQGVRLSLELNAESVSTAVGVFIQQKVLQLSQDKNYDDETKGAVLDHLYSNANDTFLWVALVCQNLKEMSRLNVVTKLKSFPPGLNSLYERMMQHINDSDDAELCKRVLATITVAYRPITLEELSSLVGELDGKDLGLLQEIVSRCGSLLTIRDGTIYFVHQSAKDFLQKEAFNTVFPSGSEEAHYAVFLRSLLSMSKMLQRDMYRLGRLGYPIEEVYQLKPDPLAPLRYSCTYWIDHLCDWSSSTSAYDKDVLQDGGLVDSFLRKKYLYWLEALSLNRNMSEGVLAIGKLNTLAQKSTDGPGLTNLLEDARRFIMAHKSAIENSPLQAYASALLFSPTRSLIRGLFKKEEMGSVTIKPGMQENWSACLSTLEGHSDFISSVAFSHDSTRLASGSGDHTVKIWDVSSGKCLSTLEGRSSHITSVAFSHDSTRLASGSRDDTVKIWDVSSGKCLSTLEGHSSFIFSVAFSHDSTRLASGSYDDTVKIWDVSSGKCLSTLEGHSSFISSVAFSHDSTRLASGSYDGTVKIWDVSSGKCLSTLEGYSNSISSVAFSHDSTRLASGSYDDTVKIWDVSSGKCLSTLKGHSSHITSVAFSHDSTRLANSISSVAFSHDSTRLASGSGDGTVKIWDVSSGKCLSTLKGHSNPISSVAFSHDSTRLASGSYDRTVKIWDVSSGKCLSTLKGHSNSISSVAFSHDSTRLASGSYDRISNQGLSLSLDNMWITYNSENLLWLPSEYRPSRATVSKKTIGIGTGGGRVWICEIQ
ncbi:WD40 repeat-like protein [Lindgomyces ingoldianus]|uniref:WD40 repeat-like protein n=1 Tax=Lindgomyces ingoldianus TaxID=673940 RepID=A0ACB6REP9_9PLEO|nr:WD40 repeat-like protein [Lindgomyces ingoldianus]KAF2476795.1 WD40 repeat-like protein [Lindgomyces ingoldianus]